jgi:cyclophilin family peptidyl-prolyl cis-trans isomerase
MYRLIGLLLVLGSMSCSKKTLDFMIQSDVSSVAPAEYTFVNQSEGFDQYKWSFGDGMQSSDSIAEHTYYLSGQYDIILKAQKGKKVKELKKQIIIAAPEICLVQIETTFGNMLVELFDDTPLHRDNFLKLAEGGFYDSLIFHRVINGFMIQGGDPSSKGAPIEARLGSGGPGYQIDAEILPNHGHVKGALAAARLGGPSNPEKRSSGSQFYIVHGKPVSANELQNIEYRTGITYTESIKTQYAELGGAAFLDQDYTVFGQVIKGLEVIDAIAQVKTNGSDRPLENVLMSIKVIK